MSAANEPFYEVKARIVSVLANPRRLEIVDLLCERERTVSELSGALGIAQATTSQHLAVMRKAGVVETRKDGNFVYYRLADPRIANACRAMSEAVLGLLESQQQRLRPLLAGAKRRVRAG